MHRPHIMVTSLRSKGPSARRSEPLRIRHDPAPGFRDRALSVQARFGGRLWCVHKTGAVHKICVPLRDGFGAGQIGHDTTTAPLPSSPRHSVRPAYGCQVNRAALHLLKVTLIGYPELLFRVCGSLRICCWASSMRFCVVTIRSRSATRSGFSFSSRARSSGVLTNWL